MALRIKQRPRDGLIAYAGNPRTHSEEQVDQLVASILEYGWTNPILIDEGGNVIAGHGRLMAAERLGLDMVPTITLTGLTAEQRKAYVIADNRMALNAGWDADTLAAELAALSASDFDIKTLGFSGEELAEILGVVAVVDFPGMPAGAQPDVRHLTFTMSEEAMAVVLQTLARAAPGDNSPTQRTTALLALCERFNA